MFRKCALAIVLVLLSQLIVTTFFAFDTVRVSKASGTSSTGGVVFSVYNSEDVPALATQYRLSTVRGLFTLNTYWAAIPDGTTPDAVAANLSGDYRVDTASADYSMGLVENSAYFNQDAASFRFDPATGTNLTTDTGYSTAQNQWAWQKTNLGRAQYFSRGQGVTVAVLDTGVDFNHPDLKSHTLPGFDAFGTYPDGRDVQGHGTFVAGIIAQIAPDATILPVRVLDANGLGTVDTVMDGLQYALDHGAKVANLSLSSNMDSSTLHKLIQSARSKGMTVISAAGNDNSGAKYFPAAYGENIGISATDSRDYRADFANWQSYMQLSAPGVDIYSTWIGGGYGWASGTSFSTPIATGAATLIRSHYPAYSPDKVRDTLKNAVDKFGSGCKCGGMGAGRLNFSKIK
ncbi:MAG TPA: S8 family serine peptidase [Chloroflexia bacterium]|nr:S8 family serine peptidase [Chloroflexia bacterium]